MPIDVLTGRSVSGTRPPLVAFSSPGGTANLVERINGVSAGKPLQSLLIAVNGQFKWYNASGTFTNATGAGAASAETGVSLYARTFLQEVFIPQFDDKPWVFNYDAGTVIELVETAGTIPNDLRFFEVWQGALWGAGALATPHIIYGSRVGDAYDWDFAAAATDTAGAFFSGGENEGRLRGPITALMPQTADTMIVSTTEGLVAMRAHPRDGGIFDDIGGVYVLGQGAWCKVPGDSIYMMTRLGMYTLSPAPGSTPVPVSTKHIPDELVGLAYDYEDPTVELEFDSRYNGIWITVRDSTSPQAWFFDLATGGFHQQEIAAYPYRITEFFEAVNEDQSGVLFAGAGYGGLARADRTGTETFDSDLIIGPFSISPNVSKASKIVQARVVFGGDSPTSEGTMSFAVGGSAEEAIRRLEDGTGQYDISLLELDTNNGVCHPHISGHAGAIRIEQTGGRCVIEEIQLTLVSAGIARMVRYKTPSVCQGYVTATPSFAPSGALTSSDGVEVIDLSAFPSDWWALAGKTGGNVRVTDADNNFIPFDLAQYSKAANTGEIWLKRALPLTPTAVRCWVCNSNVAKFPLGSAFGQLFAYPSWMLAIWPQGSGPARTPLDWPLTHTFDSLPTNGPISGDPPPVGGGEPETCPAGDEINYFALVEFDLGVDLTPPPDAQPDDIVTVDLDNGENNHRTFGIFLGLEYTNVCSSDAEEGDPGNNSIAFAIEPTQFVPDPNLTQLFRITRVNGNLSTTLVPVAPDLGSGVHLVRVRVTASTNRFQLFIDGTEYMDFNFGTSAAKPSFVNWRTLAPNMEGVKSSIPPLMMTDLESEYGSLNTQYLTLRRSKIHDSWVTGALTSADQDALDHLEAQLDDLSTYWGSWSWNAAPDTDLDEENE
jgi:hypothetical protein